MMPVFIFCQDGLALVSNDGFFHGPIIDDPYQLRQISGRQTPFQMYYAEWVVGL